MWGGEAIAANISEERAFVNMEDVANYLERKYKKFSINIILGISEMICYNIDYKDIFTRNIYILKVEKNRFKKIPDYFLLEKV